MNNISFILNTKIEESFSNVLEKELDNQNNLANTLINGLIIDVYTKLYHEFRKSLHELDSHDLYEPSLIISNYE